MIFYHGSPQPLQIGTILRSQGGELVGRGIDEVLEQYRPKNIPLPRHEGVFLVHDIDEGEEHWHDDEHIYIVEPLGPVYGSFHVSFVNEIDSVLNLENQPEWAPDLAQKYWSGEMRDQPGEEYYTEAARVVKYLGVHHEIWGESTLNDIRRRAGLPLKEDMSPAVALDVFKKHGVDPRGMDKDALRKARARINMTGKVHPERGGSVEAMQELNAATDVLIAQPQAKPADFQDFEPKQAGQGSGQGKKPGWRPFTDFVKQYQDVQRGPRPTKTYRGKA